MSVLPFAKTLRLQLKPSCQPINNHTWIVKLQILTSLKEGGGRGGRGGAAPKGGEEGVLVIHSTIRLKLTRVVSKCIKKINFIILRYTQQSRHRDTITLHI